LDVLLIDFWLRRRLGQLIETFTMPFCSGCRSLQATVFGEALQSITLNLQRYQISPGYTTLASSAEQGCPLCGVFLKALSDTERIKAHDKVDLTDDGRPLYPAGRITIGGQPATEGSYSIVMDHAFESVGIVKALEMPLGWEDPWGTDDKQLDTNDKAVAAIDYWIKKCLFEHPECQQHLVQDFIPTRVIAVGQKGDDYVQLVDKARDKQLTDKRYVALSHCWGLNMPASARTTGVNFADHLKSIPLSDLTTTFVDAIKITRRLGIPYVWIDSLCIIQGSAEDWGAEAAQMSAVYTCAQVTLSASGSSDGSQGCRIRGDEVPYVDVPLNGGEVEAGSKTQRKYRVCAWPEFSDNHMDRDPLHSRGWCLQERELSPRIAHFSRDTVRWECRKLQTLLPFPWIDSLNFIGHLRVFDQRSTRHAKLDPTPRTVLTDDVVIRASGEWFRLVRLYNTRSLTQQTDALPALGGLARVFSGFTKGEYHAGHFPSHGLVSFLWANMDERIEERKNSHSKKVIRPNGYIAPSWSWASLIGPIRWSWSFLPHEKIEDMSSIISINTEPLAKDAFGQVKSGTLKIKGKLRKLDAKEITPAWMNNSPNRQDLFANVNGIPSKVGSISFDVSAEAQQGTIFGLACTRIGEHPVIFGLALVPVGGEQGKAQFRRVGRINTAERTWREDAPTTEVTIV
jgi:hypothetical protein